MTLRRLASVLLTWCVASAVAPRAVRAEGDGLLHYEPPPVDHVYPLEGDIPLAREPLPAPSTEAASATPEPSTPPSPPATSTPSGQPPAPPEYGASARVVRSTLPGPKKIELQSARDLPGAFGDPLRILDSLPGVTPIASGLPYVYVRGAPPAAQGYVYDDIPLPQLFHGIFFPAVIHPRAMGDMRFYAGVAPTRYGRRAGGLVLAEGLAPTGKLGAELELRLWDVGAWVEAPVGNGNLMMSGRVGYPKLAILAAQSLGIVEPGTDFKYLDGQVRYRVPLGRHDRFEAVWLGAYDTVNLPGVSNDPHAGATRLEFHRLETRLTHEITNGEIGAALRFGYDHSELGDALDVTSYTIGPRAWSRFRLGQHTLRVGGDLYTTMGHIVDGPGPLGSPQGDIQVSVPKIAEASARNQGGVWTEVSLQTSEHTRLEAGVRVDYWSVESRIDVAVDPRARIVYDVTDKLELHAAAGTAHQPSVFLLPVPGLTDVALSKGLTSSYQSEAGAGYELASDLRIEAQGFFHHYEGLLLPELVTDGAIGEDPPLSSANSYGMELFLKRELGSDLSGWLSYTLGWAEADSGPDVIGKFRPDFDVRHVLNAVAQYRLWRGLTVGARFQARSGRLVEQLNPRYEQRLPWFTRLDTRIGYAWKGRWANMTAYVEWLNVFVRREYLDADCFFGQCRATSAPPVSLPNLGIRAEL